MIPFVRKVILLLCFFPALVQGDQKPVVLFLGDSLTAGYGLDQEDAFPAQVERIAEEAGIPIIVINAGLSGETSAGGLRRAQWVLRRDIDIMVLALGANDGLRGLPVEHTRDNLRSIIEYTLSRHKSASILLAGMLAPPNMGPEYTETYAGMYEELATEFSLLRIPFLLEGVAGVASLNLADGIHPNAEGQRIVARNVWSFLEPILRDRMNCVTKE
jgi:acyl-CoA thioesterase I